MPELYCRARLFGVGNRTLATCGERAIPYAVAVSLETAPEVELPLYEQVAERLRVRTVVRVNARPIGAAEDGAPASECASTARR